jgi:hypothetical protein
MKRLIQGSERARFIHTSMSSTLRVTDDAARGKGKKQIPTDIYNICVTTIFPLNFEKHFTLSPLPLSPSALNLP